MIRILLVMLGALAYLAVGLSTSGHAARTAYRWIRANYPYLARDNPREGVGEAVAAALVNLLAWPLVMLFFGARFFLRIVAHSFSHAVENSIPEYRVERDRQLAAELDRKIKRQQAEIARLEREIKG